MSILNKFKREKEDCLKLRDKLIETMLSGKEIYLSNFEITILKNLFRLDKGLIENDRKIISYYSEIAHLENSEYYARLFMYKEIE